MKLRPGRQLKPHKTQVKVCEVFQMTRKLQRLHTEAVNNNTEVSADLQKSRMFKVSQIEDSRWETAIVTNGERKLTAKEETLQEAQQCTNQGLAGPIAKARRTAAIGHTKLRRKRRNEEHQARQKLKELGRLDELFFTPKLAPRTLKKLSRTAPPEEFGSTLPGKESDNRRWAQNF